MLPSMRALRCTAFSSKVSANSPQSRFRVIIPSRRGQRIGTLYGYVRCTADDLQDAAATYADPQQVKILLSSRIDTKPMPTAWQPGKRLGFEVLVRPVIRRARGSDRAGKECDAFQAEAERHGKGAMPRSREEVYADWLRERLESRGGGAIGKRTAGIVPANARNTKAS